MPRRKATTKPETEVAETTETEKTVDKSTATLKTNLTVDTSKLFGTKFTDQLVVAGKPIKIGVERN